MNWRWNVNWLIVDGEERLLYRRRSNFSTPQVSMAEEGRVLAISDVGQKVQLGSTPATHSCGITGP